MDWTQRAQDLAQMWGSCKQVNEHEGSGTFSTPIINLPRTG